MYGPGATIAMLLLVGFLSFGGSARAAERTVTFRIDNMTCASCPFIVRKSMGAVAGVKSVEVSFESKTATVIFDDERTDPAAIAKASAEHGYPAHLVATDREGAPVDAGEGGRR